MSFRPIALARLAIPLLVGLVPLTATAQQQRDEQFYYPGGFNWQFLNVYPEAARLFNAFDYGHAVLYERLYTHQGKATESLEKEYRYLTTDLLVRPPRFAIAEEAVMPAYAKVAWRAKQMFDWAHLLHRQIYDVYADERLTPVQRDSLIERLTDYYLSRKDYAFSAAPKAMALMDEQPFSQTFRKGYPKFNGLIWSYHWLQVGLYEPFIEGRTKAEKKAGLAATVARFWSMLEDAPARFPREMPMTSAVAPRFSAAHPRAAVIFDNLHMTHDIISDILVSDRVPQKDKGAEINRQLDKLQDSTRDVMTLEEWRTMGAQMGGVDVMGGPATGLLRQPQATPPAMSGGMHDMDGMRHAMPKPATAASDSSGHAMSSMAMPDSAMKPDRMRAMMELHARMMRDPVIRQRIVADTAMRRMMDAMGRHDRKPEMSHP